MRKLAKDIGTTVIVIVLFPWLGNPLAYVHWENRFRTIVPIAWVLGGGPCETRRDGFIYIDPGPDCYRFGSPREFHGVWRNEFEGSSFWEDRSSLPIDHRDRLEAWLSPDWTAQTRDAIPQTDGVFQISFVGRKTSISGSHGHVGMWPHLIIVDEITGVKKIGPLPGD